MLSQVGIYIKMICMSCFSLNFRQISKVREILKELSEGPRFHLSKNHIQHGTTSVFEHSLSVCYFSLKFSNFFHMKVDERSLIRGALLHDFFLYDWHKVKLDKLHGFNHPNIALKNAKEDYTINEIETDIIEHHMFPLTIKPPKTKEAFLVNISDKLCSLYETFKMNEWFGGIWSRKKADTFLNKGE